MKYERKTVLVHEIHVAVNWAVLSVTTIQRVVKCAEDSVQQRSLVAEWSRNTRTTNT
jgi:hypothetical protein